MTVLRPGTRLKRIGEPPTPSPRRASHSQRRPGSSRASARPRSVSDSDNSRRFRAGRGVHFERGRLDRESGKGGRDARQPQGEVDAGPPHGHPRHRGKEGLFGVLDDGGPAPGLDRPEPGRPVVEPPGEHHPTTRGP